jgi:hypothetical protein
MRDEGISTSTATMLVIASMVGTGVFTTSGFSLASLGSKPAVLVAWLVGGVLALCGALGASTYRNAIGGLGLYHGQDFQRAGIELQFIRARLWEYPQFGQPFVPWLSILDVLMFNPLEQVRDRIRSGFDVVGAPA